LCTVSTPFAGKAAALAHINKQHKNRTSDEQALLMGAEGMECFQCDVCLKSYATKANLATHITRISSKCSEATVPAVEVVSNMVHNTCLSDDEYDECSKLLLKPLTSLHPSWVPHLVDVVHELLGDMVVPSDTNRNVRGAQALMLLAGVVEYTRDTKEVAAPSDDEIPSPPVMRVIDFLRKLTRNPGQVASRILFVATSVKPPPPRRRRGVIRVGGDEEDRAPTISDKAQALCMTAKMNIGSGKITIAGKQLEQAEALLRQEEQGDEDVGGAVAALTHSETINKIKSLHPARNDMDDLPGLSTQAAHSLHVERRTVEDMVRGMQTDKFFSTYFNYTKMELCVKSSDRSMVFCCVLTL
jgi:hypothetical protein